MVTKPAAEMHLPVHGTERARAQNTVTVRHNLRGHPRTIWEMTRLQVGGALLLAFVSGLATCIWLSLEPPRDPGVQISFFGSVIAILTGFAAFRKTSLYPGVKASFHILPAFTLTFGLVLVALIFSRLEYSRAVLLSSFAPTVLWFYFLYFKLQRMRTLTVGVVPVGEIAELVRLPGIAWSLIDSPEQGLEGYDAIVADLRADIPADWQRFLAERVLAGTLVMDRKQVEESLTGKVAIDHIWESTLGSRVSADLYGKCKRVLDCTLAIALLVLLLPAFLVLAVLIRIDSPGPALFVQERVGYRGHPFRMYKFRSMYHAVATPVDARAFAVTNDNDVRVTRIGRVLRRYRMDELPQILNIVKGEMSWIGPRPEAIALSEWYQAELSFYVYRHIVRPGLTGWAQVKQGHVADVTAVRAKLHYDFYYIKNFSIWLDLLIVFGTIRAIATGAGAR